MTIWTVYFRKSEWGDAEQKGSFTCLAKAKKCGVKFVNHQWDEESNYRDELWIEKSKVSNTGRENRQFTYRDCYGDFVPYRWEYNYHEEEGRRIWDFYDSDPDLLYGCPKKDVSKVSKKWRKWQAQNESEREKCNPKYPVCGVGLEPPYPPPFDAELYKFNNQIHHTEDY